MGFLKRAIRDGISKGIGDAIGKAVQQAVEPRATEFANKAAEQFDQAAQTTAEQSATSSKELNDAFANLQRSMEGYTAEMGKQMQAAAAENDATVLAQWNAKLPQYPIWCCGGFGYRIEEFDGVHYFSACFETSNAAQNAVVKYREVLMLNGFVKAGEYPSTEHLYKKIGDQCYHVDTEHCFDSDTEAPTIGFAIGEPTGGFN